MEDRIVTDEHDEHIDAPDEDEASWRHRALAAESKLEQAEEELGAARRAVDDAERRREAERLLLEHGALDLETALMLTEAAVAQMDEPDVAAAIDELRKRKTFLFTRRSRSSAMSERTEQAPDPLGDVAEEARASGDRRALLRYLRLKRTGA
jgi:hypothetical protein